MSGVGWETLMPHLSGLQYPDYLVMLSMLCKNFSRLSTFFLIYSKNRIWHIIQTVSIYETVCMKCQILFSGKEEKYQFSFANFAQGVLKVKQECSLGTVKLCQMKQCRPNQASKLLFSVYALEGPGNWQELCEH